KTVVVTFDPLALIAEKTNVSRSKEKVVISSNSEGRNMSYLTDYEEIDGGYVAFGGNPKGGKITSKESKSSQDDRFQPSSDDGKKVDEDPRQESKCKDQEKENNDNSTNYVNAASRNRVNVVEQTIKTFKIVCLLGFLSQEEPKKTLVDLPYGNRAIGTKWVIKNKKDERGIMIRNKARLVAQGHTQEERIDYDEVFAPIARIEAIRSFLACASFKDFVVYQMDVKSAFLYGKIEEEVYVFQPPGFEDPDFSDKVYKVKSALYELHQSPKAWYETLSTYLLDNGFHRGKIDKTLFIRRYKDDILLVQVYVDDIIFSLTKKELFKNASTPIETHKPLLKDEDGKEVDVHMYLKGHPKLGLWYPKYSPFDLVAYTDSDYAEFWTTTKAKNVNGEVQLQDLVDGKKVIITESTIRRDLQLEDAEGVDCLPNAAIFEQLTLIGVGKDFLGRVTPLFLTTMVQAQKEIGKGSANPIDPHHIPTIIPPSTSQPQKKQKSMKTKRKDTELPQTSVPISVVDEAVNEKMDDRTSSGGGPMCQEAIGDDVAQTRSGRVSKVFNDPLLAGLKTPRSGEDSMKLTELIKLCTKLQQRVLDLETTKTTQALEINSLKRRVRKLERRKMSRTHRLKRLYKVGLSARVESSKDEGLGKEDASKHGRIADIDANKEIYLVNVHTDKDIFGVNDDELQQRVLDLETTKTTQALEINSLKRRVRKLKRRKRSRTHRLKRLYKVGLSARVKSSEDEGLGKEDASKQGRIADIDANKEIYLVNVHTDKDIFGVNDDEVSVEDAEMLFDVADDLRGEEVIVSQEVPLNVAAVTTTTATIDDITLAQALAELKSAKPKAATTTAATTITVASSRPKAKGIVIHDQEQAPTPTVSSQQPS
nr:ribonuclease H-like domain, reverse transcriptase, RNA-dependent DNA polymerase [Tanacetum cinerariifolium]